MSHARGQKTCGLICQLPLHSLIQPSSLYSYLEDGTYHIIVLVYPSVCVNGGHRWRLAKAGWRASTSRSDWPHILIRRSSPFFIDASPTHQEFLARCLTSADLEPRCNEFILVAHEIWHKSKAFIFRSSNEPYDYAQGHYVQHLLVKIIKCNLHGIQAWNASPTDQNHVNYGVARLHNLNGYGHQPPFVEDHTTENPPRYPNPRDVKLLMDILKGKSTNICSDASPGGS